jgi:hypothetical protein
MAKCNILQVLLPFDIFLEELEIDANQFDISLVLKFSAIILIVKHLMLQMLLPSGSF